MAEALILEFTGDPALYHKVSEILGTRPDGTGDWPQGLLTHLAASKSDGMVIFEVWESQAKQETFMIQRLGPAMAQAGVPQPTRVEWFSLVGQMSS